MPVVYIPILSYHRVVDDVSSPLCVTPAEFRRQMEWLAANGYRGVPLADAVAGRAGRLSGQAGGAGGAARDLKAFTVTFDHGYADSFRNAFPVLKEHHIPAHFFLVTDLIDTKKLLELPEGINTDPARDRLMTWNQVMDLREAAMDIGSMGSGHIDLTAVDAAAAKDDVERSRETIRGFIGINPDYLSYPFGRFTPAVKEMVKDTGFKGAVHTPEGKTGGMDRHSLRRIAVRGGLSEKVFAFKISEKADSLRENPTMFGIMKALGKAFD